MSLKGKKVVFVIADEGFQQVEYGVPKGILEAEGIKVITASNKPGGAVAVDNSTTPVDITLDQLNVADYDGIFFIGGGGAMDNLDHDLSYKIINEARRLNIPFGAICISTRILAKAGALVGVKVTGWDDDNALETILKGNKAIYEKAPIVTDGLVVTATGPQSAKEFAEGIKRVLTKKALGS